MNKVMTYNTESGSISLESDVIKKYIVSGNGNVSDAEVFMFMNLCKHQKLNPFLREIYLVKYSDKSPATMVVGKDTFTKRAYQHPNFDGFKAGIIVIRKGREDVIYREGSAVFNVLGETLIGGWASVSMKNISIQFREEVSLSEYIAPGQNGRKTQWDKMPATMIRKVALVHALREAMPESFQGLYDESEINVVDNTSTPKTPKPEHATTKAETKIDPVSVVEFVGKEQIFELFELARQDKSLLQSVISQLGYKRSVDIKTTDVDAIKEKIVSELKIKDDADKLHKELQEVKRPEKDFETAEPSEIVVSEALDETNT
jgi:phage recombination protein Bet